VSVSSSPASSSSEPSSPARSLFIGRGAACTRGVVGASSTTPPHEDDAEEEDDRSSSATVTVGGNILIIVGMSLAWRCLWFLCASPRAARGLNGAFFFPTRVRGLHLLLLLKKKKAAAEEEEAGRR
jgi:hypothetical protein